LLGPKFKHAQSRGLIAKISKGGDIRRPRQALSANQMIYKKRKKREDLPLFDPRHTESSHPHLGPAPCLCGSSGFKFPTMLQPEHMLCDTGNATSTVETPFLMPPPCETSLLARGSHKISEDEIDDMSTACCHICLKSECEPCEPPPPFDFTPCPASML
jgi:hypothetical protein